MTIPGRGDLAPRRHQTPLGRWLITLLVLVLLGTGGYFAYLGLRGGSSPTHPAAVLPACPTAAPVGPTNPHQVRLVVLNGTLQTGLAGRVSAALKHRGFKVSQPANTVLLVNGVATVHYPSGRLRDAQAVADQVKGARLVESSGSELSLDLGQKFHALASVAQARAARARLVKAATASTGPVSTPTASPTCRA
ncbi:MAG TPA: LytR C-terminal domain-containing protein [Mycobacteriales bacterium]|nr:LytR C-terminal domain-containing protein [Mycobacteriales bacterium]